MSDNSKIFSAADALRQVGKALDKELPKTNLSANSAMLQVSKSIVEEIKKYEAELISLQKKEESSSASEESSDSHPGDKPKWNENFEKGKPVLPGDKSPKDITDKDTGAGGQVKKGKKLGKADEDMSKAFDFKSDVASKQRTADAHQANIDAGGSKTTSPIGAVKGSTDKVIAEAGKEVGIKPKPMAKAGMSPDMKQHALADASKAAIKPPDGNATRNEGARNSNMPTGQQAKPSLPGFMATATPASNPVGMAPASNKVASSIKAPAAAPAPMQISRGSSWGNDIHDLGNAFKPTNPSRALALSEQELTKFEDLNKAFGWAKQSTPQAGHTSMAGLGANYGAGHFPDAKPMETKKIDTSHGSYHTEKGADGKVDVHYTSNKQGLLSRIFGGNTKKKLGSFNSEAEAHAAMEGHNDKTMAFHRPDLAGTSAIEAASAAAAPAPVRQVPSTIPPEAGGSPSGEKTQVPLGGQQAPTQTQPAPQRAPVSQGIPKARPAATGLHRVGPTSPLKTHSGSAKTVTTPSRKAATVVSRPQEKTHTKTKTQHGSDEKTKVAQGNDEKTKASSGNGAKTRVVKNPMGKPKKD